MICLTGDVHHMSMRTLDQKRLAGTELRATLRYVGIARSKGLKVTLFVTGKAAAEEPDIFQEIGRVPGVEIGGHGFRGRRPRWVYELLFRRLLGRQNGPAFYQAGEIRKTCLIMERLRGAPPRCWRDHAYKLDGNTRSLLAAQGISLLSDEVDLAALGPRADGDGLVSLPMNVWPDHDTLAHGPYRGSRRRTTDSSGPGWPPQYQERKKWLETVKGQTADIVRNGGLATLLIHPACMEAADGFETFAELCDFLSRYSSIMAVEALTLAVSATGADLLSSRGRA